MNARGAPEHYDGGVSDHRRRRSRHRDVPGRHRTLARGGRVGVLLGALVTTSVVGVVGFATYATPEHPSAGPSPDRESSLEVGLDSLSDSDGDDASTEPIRDIALPAGSGHGRRVVFDMSGQRVWIVGGQDGVRTTYLVSGSTSDNLRPGGYRVYSRSRHAVGYDYHSTMQYFVRFAHGRKSTIGFHDIPVDGSGQRVQSYDDLGTPQSAGCIRQRRSDARVMWRFAHLDTRVVVVA